MGIIFIIITIWRSQKPQLLFFLFSFLVHRVHCCGHSKFDWKYDSIFIFQDGNHASKDVPRGKKGKKAMGRGKWISFGIGW